MKKITLTCEDHPQLRWRTKEVAVNPNGRYNGRRNIFYDGKEDGTRAEECNCSMSKLITLDKYHDVVLEEDREHDLSTRSGIEAMDFHNACGDR